jgi:hypothetical protein
MQENNLETHLYTYTDGGDKNSDDLEYMRIEVELEERVTSRAVDAQERSGARQGALMRPVLTQIVGFISFQLFPLHFSPSPRLYSTFLHRGTSRAVRSAIGTSPDPATSRSGAHMPSGDTYR